MSITAIRKFCTMSIASISSLALGMAAQAAVLVGVQGEFYDNPSAITSMTAAEAIIAGKASADATWDVSGIDYPNGLTEVFGNSTSLATFIGTDAVSLSQDFAVISTSVFRFFGQIYLDGTETTFSVGSDDGFVLRINGMEIGRHEGIRAFDFTDLTPGLGIGLYTFELIYFENNGETGVEFAIDNAIVFDGIAPNAVPLPGAAIFLLTGLGSMAIRRRKAS